MKQIKKFKAHICYRRIGCITKIVSYHDKDIAELYLRDLYTNKENGEVPTITIEDRNASIHHRNYKTYD